MEKAYDRLNWNYLKAALNQFGFHRDWIQLVERCWSKCWFSILINGVMTGFFHSSRGLRQGDPISLGLFILAVEGLSRGFRWLVASGVRQPYKMCPNCPIVSHLLFANDTILFANGSRRSLTQIKTFLTQYESVHIFQGRPKRTYFQAIIEKIQARISAWQNRILSQVGRLTLITHVLNSISVHTLASMEVPSNILAELEKQFADFFWGWEGPKKKCHWHNWRSLLLPKSEGGLGLRPLKSVM
ncbi:uncharacterized protein LOC131232384 [Magnolia sinica]|uniref:uncharacterized protein LOC131232384 n=1 Tax=Magnolia sinica TaxID=86752 RepID=UPI00265929E9|nr:uncharacterized protein LOC131232384 [Magnolia sinica]